MKGASPTMPRRNRVTPFGTLIATPARGTLTGNRGCLHDRDEQIRRPFLGQRWIFCLLDFKGRKRSIMTPGHYTELFFLDEATALAAGHRPCAECQRERFNHFRETWASANPESVESPRPAAPALDAVLHRERTATGLQDRGFCDTIDELPDGTFVADQGQTAYLVLRNQLQHWRPTGYEKAAKGSVQYPLQVLTPASIVRALAAGYQTNIHESALPD